MDVMLIVNSFYMVRLYHISHTMNIMSLPVLGFTYNKHRSEGKEERLDWIISELKKQPGTFIIPDNILPITRKIEECCRLLRMSASTRKDWTEQILMELKII